MMIDEPTLPALSAPTLVALMTSLIAGALNVLPTMTLPSPIAGALNVFPTMIGAPTLPVLCAGVLMYSDGVWLLRHRLHKHGQITTGPW